MTVVLCTRDRPEMLASALAALVAALPSGTDLVVVDSASRLGSTADVARAAGVRSVRTDVPGLSIARNLGLESTTREIVVFTDDDCAVEPGFLEKLIAPFGSPGVAATTGSLRDVGERPETSAPPLPAPPETTLRRTTAGLDAGHGALMAFRRSVLLELGGFDPVLGAGRRFGGAEDMDAFCRVLDAGLELVRVPAAVVTHVYTRSDDDYLRLNENYGLGIGAMCAKWLRTSRREGIALTAVILRRGAVRYLRRIRVRRTRLGQGAYLRAVLRGLREARRLPLAGAVFADQSPPTAIPVRSDAL